MQNLPAGEIYFACQWRFRNVFADKPTNINGLSLCAQNDVRCMDHLSGKFEYILLVFDCQLSAIIRKSADV